MLISKSEQSYICTSLLANPPHRADGRSLLDTRSIVLSTGVAPLANGSARACIGESEVIAAVRLEVEDCRGVDSEGRDGGRIVCSVVCSQSAYANHTSAAIDDLSADLSTLLQSTLSTTLTPSPQLTIVPNLKSWLLTLDAVIISDSGNIVDTLFIAARAALWDTRIPRTRSVEFQSREEGNLEKGDVFKDAVSTGKMSAAVDFELMDYWDDGEPLVGREAIPVCITLNLLPPAHFVDATTTEELSVLTRLLLFFSFVSQSSPSSLHGMRLLGPGEVPRTMLRGLLMEGEKYARELTRSLNTKLLREEQHKPR